MTEFIGLLIDLRNIRSTATWLCVVFLLLGSFNLMSLYEVYANLLPYEGFWDVLTFGGYLQVMLLAAFTLLALWSARGAYVGQ